jgi:putative ABC transport system permease protein
MKFLPLVLKQIVRHRTRSLLTVAGVAMAMFLFCAVQALQKGVTDATHTTAKDTVLVVYRENRFCPFTSRLPAYYEDRIRKVPGVASVVPMKIVVNNCRASLDVITYRGVPDEGMQALAGSFTFLSGGLDQWRRRGDGAIVGEALAARRGLKVGQSFDAAGFAITIEGIVRSPEPQDQFVAYVHLDFLQRVAARGGDGIVTQFNVRVDDPSRLEEVARQIDEQFRADPEPTQTRPEKAFVASAAGDLIHIAGFTRWLGWGCLIAVLALVGNAIVLSVQDRIKEHAVLQTLGFRRLLIAHLIILEGAALALAGGALGTLLSAAIMRWGRFALTVDGVSMGVDAGLAVILTGLAISAALGILAGLAPAVQASRRQITACFRAA